MRAPLIKIAVILPQLPRKDKKEEKDEKKKKKGLTNFAVYGKVTL